MILSLGYVLISARVVRQMGRDQLFAVHVGESLGRHIRGDWGCDRVVLEYEYCKSVHARYGNIMIVTEPDKNHMPRTTVVFLEEVGQL
jgi:hypothetical protein